MSDAQYRDQAKVILEKHYGFVEPRTLELLMNLHKTYGVILAPKQVKDLKQVLDVQGRSGNWDYDTYMHGMFNGMELMMSIVQGRERVYRKAPKKWLADIKPKSVKAEPEMGSNKP